MKTLFKILLPVLLAASPVWAENCRTFDGVADYFVRDSNITGVSNFPVSSSLWVRCDVNETYNFIFWLGRGPYGAANSGLFLCYTCPAAQKFRMMIIGISDRWAQTNGSYTTSQWHNVISVYTSAVSRMVYLDGVAGTSNNSASTAWVDDVNRIVIGAVKYTTAQEFFDGSLSNVAFYNCALDANAIDITNLSTNKYAPGLVCPGHLKAWWKLDEANAADDAVDATGNGYTLTAVSSPTVSSDGPDLTYTLPGGGTIIDDWSFWCQIYYFP